MDRGTLLSRLSVLGWLPKTALPATVEDDEVRKALLAYQKFFGIDGDGSLDPETLRSILATRFCGAPDILPLATGLGAWATKDITWFPNFGEWPRIGRAAAIDSLEESWSRWAEVCDIRPKRVASADQALVVIGVGRIDGAFNVLAYSQLPGPNNRQRLSQTYDDAESWVASDDVRNGQIGLPAVGAHELGHALGCPHINGGPNLMNPIYDPRVNRPQAGDIREMVARYGKPKGKPPVDPPPTGAEAKYMVIMSADGTPLSKYKVEQVK